MHPLRKSSYEAGTRDKSCDWHTHFRKSSGLRHPPSFPNILFFYLVAWVKISISATPLLFGHQPYWTPPWVPQFQSPAPMACPSLVHVHWALGFVRPSAFISLPSPWIHTSDHSFSFHCLDYPLCHLDPHQLSAIQLLVLKISEDVVLLKSGTSLTRVSFILLFYFFFHFIYVLFPCFFS